MITHLGRVVYDRKKHVFNKGDAVRVIKAIAITEKHGDVARAFAQVEIEYFLKEDLGVIDSIRFIVMSLMPMATYIDIAFGEFLSLLAVAWANFDEWISFWK